MKKEYNLIGKKDKRNTKLRTYIVKLREKGITWKDISIAVERSEKRCKEIYYEEIKISNSKA